MEQYTSHRTKNGRLPQGLTPLVGREAEIADARRLLADPDCRLLTLVGPGGIGKTRLAVEVATRQRDHFRDGIHFIDLLSVESIDFLIPVIADALQFPIRGSADSQEQLLSYLKERQALLVLDNFEHLLEGVQLVSEILRAAPGVKLMATSREVLRRTFSDNGNQLRSIVATTDVRAQVLYLKAGVYLRFPSIILDASLKRSALKRTSFSNPW